MSDLIARLRACKYGTGAKKPLVQEAADALEAAQRELAKANNEFGSETAHWPDLWKRIAELKEQAGEQWRELEWAQAENERREKAYVTLEMGYNKVWAKLEQAQAENEQLQSDLAGFAVANTEQADQLEQAQRNIRKLNIELTEAGNEKSQLQADNERLTEDTQRLAETVSRLAKRIAALEKESLN